MRISDWSTDVCSSYLLAAWPLLDSDADAMRRKAEENDANRRLMLLLTAIVAVVIMVAVGVAVSQHGGPRRAAIALLLATLALADRKSGGSGKSVSVCVDIGGRGVVKNNK